MDDFGVPPSLKISTKTPSKDGSDHKHKSMPGSGSKSNRSLDFGLLSPGKPGKGMHSSSPNKKGQRKEETGWKEVIRKSKKVSVPSNAVSRVIGRGGSNINAIREISGANIELDKQGKGGDRTITIK